MKISRLCTFLIMSVLNVQMAVAEPASDPTDLDLDGVPGVAAVPEFPQPAVASVLVGTGTLLIDRSSGNVLFDVSGFTDFLASNGWTIDTLTTGPITESALSEADVLLIPANVDGPIFPFSAAEVAAIQGFVANGGGLWALNDNVDPSGINPLSSAFGVVFQYDFVRDPSNNEGALFRPTIHLLETHDVTSGVATYGYYSGDCLSVTNPAQVVARGDEDSYSLFCPVGSMPPTLAVWEVGLGRAVFAGDETPFHPSYFPERLRPEEQLLLQNIANWLLGDETTSASPLSWGQVKSGFVPRERHQ